MRRVLIEHPIFTAEQDDEKRIVIVTRHRHPTQGAELVAAFEELGRMLTVTHRQYSLILDVRNAVGNNSPDFEASANQVVAGAHRYFRNVVVLLASAAGALQARRLNDARAEKIKVLVARDMLEAIALASGETRSA
jgi:hypothetical protein